MTNNFRSLTKTLTNPRVIDANFGDDITGNGTFDTPYASIARGLVDGGGTGFVNFILGTGTYTEVTNLPNLAGGNHSIQGEKGLEKSTIWDLNGGTITLVTSNGWTNIKNLTITNGIIIMTTGGIDLNINNVIFKDIEFRDTAYTASSFVNFTDCDFVNVIGFQTSIHRSRLTRCKLINTTFYNGNASPAGYGVFKLESCDIDAFSNVELTPEAVIIAGGKVDYNNLRGKLKFQNGTNPNVYIDLATALIEHPTAMGANNINTDPLYWDVPKLVLSVQNTSPNLGTGKSGVNIGNVSRSNAYFCEIDPELNDSTGTASSTNIVGTGDKVIAPTFTQGVFRTGVLVVNSLNIETVGVIGYVGALGGTNNRPDSILGTIPTERYSYRMRFATGLTIPSPTNDLDWDNGGFLPAGVFSDFEWNSEPWMDSTYNGNGSDDYDDEDEGKFIIGAKWVQIEVILEG